MVRVVWRRSSGTIFGERELFFTRRFLNRGQLSAYMVRGQLHYRLPLKGRKRHHTATVISKRKCSLLWMSWEDVLELHTSHSYAGRQVFSWIQKTARLREEQDQAEGRKSLILSSMEHMSRKYQAASQIQRSWRRRREREIDEAKESAWMASPMGQVVNSLLERQLSPSELRQRLTKLPLEELCIRAAHMPEPTEGTLELLLDKGHGPDHFEDALKAARKSNPKANLEFNSDVSPNLKTAIEIEELRAQKQAKAAARSSAHQRLVEAIVTRRKAEFEMQWAENPVCSKLDKVMNTLEKLNQRLAALESR